MCGGGFWTKEVERVVWSSPASALFLRDVGRGRGTYQWRNMLDELGNEKRYRYLAGYI